MPDPSARPGRRDPQLRGLGVAVTAVVAQVLLAVPRLTTDDGVALLPLGLVVAPVALLTTAVLWLTVVARGGARAALLCAAASVLTLPVYPLGVTLPLAGAAIVLGRSMPEIDPERSRSGLVAMVVGMLVLLAVGYLTTVHAVNQLGAG